MKQIELNPGAQHDFVMNNARHSAYMGGRGAGKTFASIVRGLSFAYQPKVPGELPPVGCLLAVSFPHLKDIVYPAMYLVLEMAGMQEGKDWKEVKNQADRKFILLHNGAEIKMRSLDEPNKVRGLNLSWFGIDEGRLFDSDEAYKILLATLRQGAHKDKAIDEQGIWIPGENYKHAGWVTSTPNGFDWMYDRFHPESEERTPGTLWFNAPTYENKRNLPAEFIKDLESDYSGLFYQQEVLGEFVGAVGGAVWPHFDPDEHIDHLEYNPNLPLYAGWDFGVGDYGVCLFAQIETVEKKLESGIVEVPNLKILDAIEMKDKSVREWADEFYRWLERNTGGRKPRAMWGDPAGLQRNVVSATSVLYELGQYGVHVRPAPKRPIDEGIIIVQNLMARPGSFVINKKKGRIQKAVQTYRWKIDAKGHKLSREPVHDWTSHTCSALRYLAIGAIGLSSRYTALPEEGFQRGTMGYLMDQLLREDDEVVMNSDGPRRLDWHPDEQIGLSGLLG